MAKKHNVKVCKSNFKIVGNVVGTKSDRFFKQFTFDSGASKNTTTFGLQSSPTNVNYVTVEGFDGKEAWFSKWDKQTKTNDIKKVDWDDRFNFSEDGYNPFFGVRIGTTLDDKGKPEIATLFGYDASQELSETLEDGMPLYVEGQIAYTSYSKDGELKRYKNFVPQKVYLQKSELDFESDKYKEENRFEQDLVFMGIEQEKDENNKATGRFILYAKIVTRDSVEDTQFIVEDKSLADKLRKNLKEYWGISVMGRLVTRVVETEDEDSWGDDEDLHGNNIQFREMIITKAYPASIDKESYSEENLASIKQADDDFGDSVDEDEDDDVWE